MTYVIRPATNEDAAGVRGIVFSTLAEFRLPALLETTDADLYDLEASYFQTGGTFEVVVRPDGWIVGCAGLCLTGQGRAELRRLFLRPEVRRSGLGCLLLERMVEKARELECREIRLETNRVLWHAARICHRHGFRAGVPAHPSARCDTVYCFRFAENAGSSRPHLRELPNTWRVSPRSKEAGVPRQFGMGTALLMMTMFAVLFAVLKSLGVSPVEFAVIALFFFGVGAGQALLFHGQRPRRASIVMGMVMTFALVTVDALWRGQRLLGPDTVFTILCSVACGGITWGYAAGALIASVFLLRDMLLDAYARRFPHRNEPP
jgi:N-acetylglutamate synthase-like GNAT family acetyltransferase